MEEYQKELDEWYQENGWEYWTPHQMLAALVEETGEVARLINHLHGPKKKKNTEAEQELEGEIGDVLYAVICLANSNGINLDKAIRKTLDKSFTRDKDRFSGKNSKNKTR